MTHVLCIGGTGMLTETTNWLDESFECVRVIARDQLKIRGLVENHTSDFSFYKVNYQDTEKLTNILMQILTRAPIDYFIAWIHSGTAPEALPTVLNEVEQNQHSSFRLFHVKGSAHAIKKDTVLVPATCLYREVILDFQYDGTNSRWLTHSEISKGVIAAIQEDAESTTIGVLSPWKKSPS